MNVANCPRCGKIFVKGFNEVCPNCVKDLEQQYEKCLKYLRENKGTTINDLSEATGVAVKQITKFIRDGRISIMHAPNMSYPCEVCGTLIRENTICESCRLKLSKDVRNNNEDEQRREDQRKRESKVTYNIQDRLKEKR
ncbi:TIGR03826 family flagellar region protein [Paenibacillus alginolyticus]|uniref:Flagellar protein n=1 Tax=Paenibacillus alginolyticus TaxID=59839 RepID=A0ABT4GIV1_9BACL|nr:TIGR03826 family flagellar region protein [Paenibacillus alginolyticus]MCY9696118.1 flagellar protein [Paenibacillus alginolyticus]MEC0143020.1 flagellar protein [Paenibacillus alginolyticus]